MRDCKTLAIWARLAIRTRSQWLLAAIECGRGGEGVAEGVLLVKVGDAVFVADDDPPFVDDDGDLLCRVEAVHDRGMPAEEAIVQKAHSIGPYLRYAQSM